MASGVRHRAVRAAVLAVVALSGPGCYDFALTGPDAPNLSLPPSEVTVTIEYRQPRGCLNVATPCNEPVVFFASWMKIGNQIQLTPDADHFVWRGLARNVPVNYPPKDEPHFVRIFDPFLREGPGGGITGQRLWVGGELLNNFDSEGGDRESALVFIDANGLGHNPF